MLPIGHQSAPARLDVRRRGTDMAELYELKIGYFATRELARTQSDLSGYDEIFTSAFSKKNDRGGAHYNTYPIGDDVPVLGFPTADGDTKWGLIPDGGVVNPFQAGATGDGSTNDRPYLQECIDFIEWWRITNTEATNSTIGDTGHTFTERDSSQTAVKLVIPGNHIFVVDRTVSGPDGSGLALSGPITIEGEDQLTSRILFVENTVEAQSATPPEDDGPGDGSIGGGTNLFYSAYNEGFLPVENGVDSQAALIAGITFRNFRITGSYGPTPTVFDPETDFDPQSHGAASMLTIYRMDDLLLENMVFERNRAVIINGGQTRNFTMRGCLMAESRRGGLIIHDVDNVVVEDNDFRWIADDPVGITMGVEPPIPAEGDDPAHTRNAAYVAAGGHVRIVGNRAFGCRGLNVAGVKNVLIADNTHILGRGRAIHVGTVPDQDKGDTTTLNIIVRNNIITDLLDADVDPEQDQDGSGHRAIDIKLLQTAPNPVGTPGLPAADGSIVAPEPFYYTQFQGLEGGSTWSPTTAYAAGARVWALGRIYDAVQGGTSGTTAPTAEGSTVPLDGTVQWAFKGRAVTPHSGDILIEGNVISRSRPPAVRANEPGHESEHVDRFSSFESYDVGFWGGFPHRYGDGVQVRVTLDEITPDEGIAVSGSVRNLVIRGNQVRNCAVAILLYEPNVQRPLSLYDVRIEGNDLGDWGDVAIRLDGYDVAQPQRVSILNNRADGDPFHRNLAARSPAKTGKWGNVIAGSFLQSKGVGPLVIAGNHVRNVSQLVVDVATTPHVMQDNVGYCNPVAIGYHANNVGIGNLIAPQLGWRYIIEDGNPSSATYGKVLNACPLATTGVPTGGPWVAGTYVTNLTPTTILTGGANSELAGWRRMTTGTGNVVNTNWREQRVLIG